MYRPAIVPHKDVVWLPAVSIHEAILGCPGHEFVNELLAFSLTETDYLFHVGRTYVERLSPVWVMTYEGMVNWWKSVCHSLFQRG